MNRIPGKRRFLIGAALVLSFAILALGCRVNQTTPSSGASPKPAETQNTPGEKGKHDHDAAVFAPHPGDVLKISVDDLVNQHRRREARQPYSDLAVYISVEEQQSVLWTARNYEFQILNLKLDERQTTHIPPNVRERLKKGPFYREFPVDPRDRDKDGNRFFRQISSGPARLDADPGPRGVYRFKTTIRVKARDGSSFDIDPHIMTVRLAAHLTEMAEGL